MASVTSLVTVTAPDACGNAIPIEQIIDEGCGCGPVGPQGQMMYEEVMVERTESVVEEVESASEANAIEGEESQGNVVDQIDADRSEEMAANEDVPQKASFLKRISSWLNA